MTNKEAVKILTEMSKWRKAKKPYDHPGTMPYPPYKYTEAIDIAIKQLKDIEDNDCEIDPLRARIIRCITPNSKCNTPRDEAENRAWNKVKSWVREKHVKTIEEFYKAPKSEDADETWRRKHGVSALFNQLREQIDLADSYNQKKKPKNDADEILLSAPVAWQMAAKNIASQQDCAPNLKNILESTTSWWKFPSHVQSVIIEEINKDKRFYETSF